MDTIRIVRFLSVLTLAAMANPAWASEVNILLTGANGQPLANTVVSVEMPGAAKPAVRGPYVMAQRNISFDPHILIVPVGADVLFPNKDQVRHHVFSFSQPHKFELKLYGRDETKSVHFDKPGVVALGCNIHDSMSGYVFVTASPFTAITDSSGRVNIPNVPAGHGLLHIWNPALRAPANTITRPIDINGRTFNLTVAAP